MKIFIICWLLFIHVNMRIFIRGFRVSIRVLGIRWVSGIRGFGFWWWISIRIGVRFGIGFRLRVSVLGALRLHPIRTRPVAILTSVCSKRHRLRQKKRSLPPPACRSSPPPPPLDWETSIHSSYPTQRHQALQRAIVVVSPSNQLPLNSPYGGLI
jgi:hypothetical protein